VVAGKVDPWLGRRLGPYEIQEHIASGGMGEVYRAHRVDAEFQKAVAVKLMPSAGLGSFLFDRFRIERQILGTLDHPHIARLIDGGVTREGLPYLIMDLVEGRPLDRYCKENNLSIRERLRLFRDVCSAVSYAHQHLVVHRDLKPANILVTADGQVKLLDFGIAKLMLPSPASGVVAPTLIGAIPLTLDFASPEQVLGRPTTTASDVYSLGVLLYLLIAGRMPYKVDCQSTHAAVREICESEPDRPSVFAPSNGVSGGRVDRDLDAIVLKALRKEPHERYRSAEELSTDLASYLAGFPVIARGDPIGYRAKKFARRHIGGIVAAGILGVCLLGGIVASVHQARLAAQQTARAERHIATVRAFADSAMFPLHDAIKELPGATSARQLLLTTAFDYLNALTSEVGSDIGFRQELANAYIKVADLQGRVNTANTGNSTSAMDGYIKAAGLLEPIVVADPKGAAASALAHSFLQQSRLLVWEGKPAKAVEMSGRATGLFASLAKASADITARAALAESSRIHGVNLTMNADQAQAIRFVDDAVAILEGIRGERGPGQEPDLDLEYRMGLAYSNASDVYQADTHPGSVERSIDLRLKAVNVNERLVAATSGLNASYVRALFGERNNLCGQYGDLNDFVRALQLCRAAQLLLEGLRTDRNNAQIELDATSLHLNLGRALIGTGRWEEAAGVFEENVRMLQAIAAQSSSLQVEYLLAASEGAMGGIEEHHAAEARASRAERLRHWKRAADWYERAVPRFDHVASKLALTEADMVLIRSATAGLARSRGKVSETASRD